MFSELTRSLKGHTLTNPAYGFLLEEDTSGELVALHCEATSFDSTRAQLRTVAAIRLRGQRILTSQRLVIKFSPEEATEEQLERLLRYIGARPVLGYYLEFTMAMLNKLAQPLIGIPLPNRRIEVSSLYYDRKLRVFSDTQVDLRLNSIVRDLDLPERGAGGAYPDALTSALIYLCVTGKTRPPDL